MHNIQNIWQFCLILQLLNINCFSACVPGYFGQFCNESCPPGTFGDKCGGRCYPDCTAIFCHHKNGCQHTNSTTHTTLTGSILTFLNYWNQDHVLGKKAAFLTAVICLEKLKMSLPTPFHSNPRKKTNKQKTLTCSNNNLLKLC